MTKEEAELQFAEWLEANDQGSPYVPANEGWINYAPPGKAKASSSAKLTYGEEIEGVYKNFKTNTIDGIWRPTNGTAYVTDDERQRLADEAASRTTAEKAKKEAATLKALQFYYSLEPATPDHPYLVKKRITNIGPLKIHNGDLIIPVLNTLTQEIQTYQRITADGDKFLAPDCAKVGGFIMPSEIPVATKLESNPKRPVIVAEGYATAYSIYRVTYGCVIAALDCGNIKPVVEALRRRFPLREIIIAADNDTKTEGNPGVTSANAVAKLFGCKVAVPPPGDFWDLWHTGGEAAVQQCIDAAKFPEAEPDQPSPDDGAKPKSKSKIQATPFEWIDPTTIPKRRWLYKPHYIRQFSSLTLSPGGVGKSSLVIAEALGMVSAKALLGITPEEQPEGRKLRVWYWNGEDPLEELQRRVAATIKYFDLTPEDIGDRLFLDTGRKQSIIIAEEIRNDVQVYVPVVKEVIETITENKIDVLIVDPFVTCHRVHENDNAAIGRVAKAWSDIADVTNCAVMLVHHTRKTKDEKTVDDGRGASALLNSVRSARSLNTMTKAEAEKAGISEAQRRFYFRSDLGKINIAPPAENAEWYRLENVDLGNDGDEWFTGDQVGVVTGWQWPVADVPVPTVSDIARVQAAVRDGGPWRLDQRVRSEPWVGVPVAQALGRDLLDKGQKKAVAKLVGDWVGLGYLRVVMLPDRNRDQREYVEVGPQIAVEPTVGSTAENDG